MNKQIFIVAVLIFFSPKSLSFEWSADEFVDNCAVVYSDEFNADQLQILNYCMGVVKGVTSGLLYAKALTNGTEPLLNCIKEMRNISFLSVLKDVVAKMRIQNKDITASNEPNTANASVALALTELNPCLINSE
jgi:hypothetical protein